MKSEQPFFKSLLQNKVFTDRMIDRGNQNKVRGGWEPLADGDEYVGGGREKAKVIIIIIK